MGSSTSTERQRAGSRARNFNSQAQRPVVNSDIGRNGLVIHKTEMDPNSAILELKCPLRKNVSPNACISQDLHRREALRQARDLAAVKDNNRNPHPQHPTPNAPACDNNFARSTMERLVDGKTAIKHRLSDATDTESPRKKPEAQFPRDERSSEGKRYEYIIKPFKPQHAPQFAGGNIWKVVDLDGAFRSNRYINPARVQSQQTQSRKRPRCTYCASLGMQCSLVKKADMKGPCQRCRKDARYCVEGTDPVELNMLQRKKGGVKVGNSS